jgi:hypothetical protein
MHVGSFNLLYLLALAGSLDVRAVQVNEHLIENMVDFLFVTGQLLIAFIQQTFYIVMQNMRLFDGEWVNEWQRPPFKNSADIITAYIDECVGKGETIGKGTVVDDIPRGNDPQLLSLTDLQDAVFILVNKGN